MPNIIKNLPNTRLAALGLTTLLASTPAAYAVTPIDGEIALPDDYQSWPLFASHINKKAHVRDIYINPVGARSSKGAALNDGTTFVMAIYNAKKDASGNPIKDADGNLIKTDLAKVFVMQKNAGWGKPFPATQRTGDWVYAAYQGNGSKANVQYEACRACHAPLTNTDYVFHYDKFF